ncbi:MAG: 4Fe-4S binding protein [Verrucomicrobia bacterium]|nr:4Fe-4S binding protein [Verrucomicrobiota bacterium]MCF7707935.1 4Fe-4S binding protein [Verrucomicrobiota bacterium]
MPYRLWVQVGFLAVWLDPLALRMHNICGPVFHCYACPLAAFACPVGVLAQFSALHLIPFIAIGTLVLAGALFGRIICGWICPFGLFQDLVAKVPVKRFEIPRWLGAFRYVVLVGAVLLIPYLFGEGHPLFICKICPAGFLEKAVPDMGQAAIIGDPIPWPNTLKIVVAGLVITAAFVTFRPWCRVLCPLGAIFGFFNRFSVFSMEFENHHCTQCGRCRTLCTYGGKPDKSPNSDNCLRCFECTQCDAEALRVSTVFDKDAESESEPRSSQT